MKRLSIVIIVSSLGALLIGTWLFLTLRQPSRQVHFVQQPKIQVPTLYSSKKFSLHDKPRPLPQLAFNNGDGKKISLADFRGKVVLLNVWATWCGPCRREMPTLDRLQAKLGSPAFEAVALSIDRAGPDAVRKFYREIEIKNLALYIDSKNKTTPTLGIIGIPSTLLINREGQEVGRLVGPAEWDAPEMVAFLKSQLPNSAK